MGVVYRATQLALERTVAIKLIAAERAQDPVFRGRFNRESRLAASIEHVNVIPVYEAGEDDGLLFIAMRLVEGIDLAQVLERDGRARARAAGAARRAARRPRWTPHTRAGSCIATSSPPTCCSRSTSPSTSTSPTSASPSRSARGRA